MSKAFTKEDDGLPPPAARRRGVPVPELNMVTPQGLRAARAELEALTRTGGDADRIRELADHLATAQAMDPPADRAMVGLGASVTVVFVNSAPPFGGAARSGRAGPCEDAQGTTHVYRIVGAIEADPKRGAVGWQTPIGQALWGLRAGDTATLPRGEVEVVGVSYAA